MPSEKVPQFDSDYSKGPSATEALHPPVQAPACATGPLPNASVSVDAERYGIGKPYRVVIRGKISK
jgi:hypothetical protein